MCVEDVNMDTVFVDTAERNEQQQRSKFEKVIFIQKTSNIGITDPKFYDSDNFPWKLVHFPHPRY